MRLDKAALLILLALPGRVAAETASCSVIIDGQPTILNHDDDSTLSDVSYGEWMLDGPANTLRWVQGITPKCNSMVMLRYLTRNLPPEDAGRYCLSDNGHGVLLAVPGERDFQSRCRSTMCEMVDAASTEAAAITATFAGMVTGTGAATAATGTTVVAHSSGAWIITGSSGYIAGTLGTTATAVVGALTAPATVAAAVVSVVVVGGSVYVCS